MTVDVVEAEVFRRAIENLTKEMAITLERTSGSPVVTDAYDCCSALMDLEGNHIGFSGHITFHLPSSYLAVQTVRKLYPAREVHPGDLFLCNDPYTSGAIHQGDMGVVMPLFYREEQRGWAFAGAHVLDSGGFSPSGFGPTVRDCFGEGLRFPATRFMREWTIDPEWERFVETNVRVPVPVLNDLRSMAASCNTGQTRLIEIIDRYGLERFGALSEENRRLAEDALKEKIRLLPEGVYEATDWHEFDGHGPQELYELHCSMEVSGDKLAFRFTGSPQSPSFINAGPAALRGGVLGSILTVFAYDIPIMAWRVIDIDPGPPGTVVNPAQPAPVSGGHMEIGFRCGKLATETLNTAMAGSEDDEIRSRVCGEPQNACTNPTGFCKDSNQDLIVFHNMDVWPGGGAQSTADGQDSYGFHCTVGCSFPDVEVHESMYPIVYLFRGLAVDGAGPGYHRGGQGIAAAHMLYRAVDYDLTGHVGCTELPPRGGAGGYPAATSMIGIVRDAGVARAVIERDHLPDWTQLAPRVVRLPAKFANVAIGADDVVFWANGGGGGLGDPILRDAESVASDVRDGYLTAEHVAEAYGVVIDNRDLDRDGTQARRQQVLSARLGGPPTRTAQINADWFLGVRRSGGEWRCNYCSGGIAPAGGAWRDGAVTHREPLAEAFERRKMRIRSRTHPAPLLVERFCPHCGACLKVEIEMSSVSSS